MFKLYRDAFKITNDAIILAVPLALFWWVLSIYGNFSFELIDSISKTIIAIVTILLMTSTFAAGWFYMVREAVKFSQKNFILDDDMASEATKLIKTMPQGIGHFFLLFVQASFLFVAFLLGMGILIKIISNPVVSNINEILLSFDINVSSAEEMRIVLNTFSSDKLIELFNLIAIPSLKLLTIVISVPALFSFISMLWIPEIIYTRKNALFALFSSIKKVFIKLPKSISLYLYILIIQFIVSLVGAFSLVNMFLYLLGKVIYFYFLVYVVVLMFLYYDREFFNQKEKEQ